MIEKDVRALLPAWTACALAILASRWNVSPLKYLGVPAYFIGTAALGAWVMGHEYAHGTLASLLTTPISRRRVWVGKLAVAAPMLGALAAIGLFSTQLDRGDQKFGSALFVLPPIVSLFVAPWLTMLTRNPIASAVFSFGAMGGSVALGEWIGIRRYGFTDQVDAFQLAFVWWALCGLSAIGGVLGWRTFATLQAIEGHGADLEFPNVLGRGAGTTVTRRHSLLTLIAKELRLQYLPIVVAALWTLGYIFAESFGTSRIVPSGTVDVATVAAVMTLFYSLVLPAVIGSLACAQERHFNTLDAQLLLPVRCSTQWIVKSATVLILAVTLSLLLPALASAFGGAVANPVFGPSNGIRAESIAIVLGVTSISLYVSTLTRSGLHALMVSIAAIITFGVIATKEFDSGLGRWVFLTVHAMRAAHAHSRSLVFANTYVIGPLASFALLTILLVFALPHYRSAARRPELVVAHAAILVGCLIGYDVVMNAMMALRY